ncbi:hypothetical protein [Paenibacillus sp. FSL R10-2771]|uniref:hypothetical protein n=1 Tax=Paenibacillus sp. FSL R10-2771 TaxID=2954693 RepID=UPI0030F57205
MSVKDIRLMLIKTKYPLTKNEEEQGVLLKNAQKKAKDKISAIVEQKLVLK